MFVKGPAFQEIRVEARVTAPAYASLDQVELDVIAALNAELDPLAGKFGKSLSPTVLYKVILEVKGVAILSLNTYVDGRLNDPPLTVITAPPDGLFYSGNHLINVEPDES